MSYDSVLEPERTVGDHLSTVVQRLGPARKGLLELRRRFQSKENQGAIQASIFTGRATQSVEFLVPVEPLAFLAATCTSVRISVTGDPAPVDSPSSPRAAEPAMDEETNGAWIHILSPYLSSDQMTKIVGIGPDQKWNINDPISSGKGRRASSGLYYSSLLDPELPLANHIHAITKRLRPARDHLNGLKRDFQSKEIRGIIGLTMFTFHPGVSVEFLLDVDDLALLADICTFSVDVKVVGNPGPVDRQ
jgi:hypothetical protein